LEADGHVVVHALDTARGANDAQQFVHALDRQAVMVTKNGGDFRVLQYAWRLWSQLWGVRALHQGIIVLPPGQTELQWMDGIRHLLAHRGPLDNELFQWSASRDWHVLSC